MTRAIVTSLLALASLGLAPPSYADRGVQPVPVPKEGRAVDTSHPDRVVGRGTPASCTSAPWCVPWPRAVSSRSTADPTR